MLNFLKSKKGTDPFDTTVTMGLKGIYEGHYNITYRGVKCIKCPLDYVLYQMIINEVRPDLVIEIGTYMGGSALYFADLMDIMGKGQVHTIDVDNQIDERVKNHNRITFFNQDWRDYDPGLAKGFETVLVIEDGSHKYPEVLEAMIKFESIVSVNSYLIVEDGIVDELGMSGQHNGGPVRGIRQFIRGNDNFEIDHRWCDFFGKNATFNTIGFLKRVK